MKLRSGQSRGLAELRGKPVPDGKKEGPSAERGCRRWRGITGDRVALGYCANVAPTSWRLTWTRHEQWNGRTARLVGPDPHFRSSSSGRENRSDAVSSRFAFAPPRPSVRDAHSMPLDVLDRARRAARSTRGSWLVRAKAMGKAEAETQAGAMQW